MKAESHLTAFCLHHCKIHKVTIVNKCLASYLLRFISITGIQSAQLVPVVYVNTFSISHVCGAMIYILKIFLKIWISISMVLAVYCPVFSDRCD